MKKTGKEVQRWSDVAMFEAEDIDPEEGIKVSLLSCNNDPLGTIAANALAYKGEFVHSLAEISDETRRHYITDVPKSVLVMPFEAIQFHFVISGVTRAFTHQMVRQRTAAYAQESMRFAVKETMPVGRPPSLNGTIPWSQWWEKCAREIYPTQQMAFTKSVLPTYQIEEIDEYANRQATPAQIWRREWDDCVQNIETTYNTLVNSGMPAEDARGLAPTNVLTQLNYITSLRALKEHAGLRLCTQAQFEWRMMWVKMIQAIKDYGQMQNYITNDLDQDLDPRLREVYEQTGQMTGQIKSSAWQFQLIADLFRPICYNTGKCEFMAAADRHCDIRERVQANHEINRPSTEWDRPYEWDNARTCGPNGEGYKSMDIDPIFPAEWLLNPNAARVSG